jgi:hypothetical protein
MANQQAVKAGDLRKALADEKLDWQVAEQLKDAARIPIHGIGGTRRG